MLVAKLFNQEVLLESEEDNQGMTWAKIQF